MIKHNGSGVYFFAFMDMIRYKVKENRALFTKMAGSLIGGQRQRIYEPIKENVLHGIKISAVHI